MVSIARIMQHKSAVENALRAAGIEVVSIGGASRKNGKIDMVAIIGESSTYEDKFHAIGVLKQLKAQNPAIPPVKIKRHDSSNALSRS